MCLQAKDHLSPPSVSYPTIVDVVYVANSGVVFSPQSRAGSRDHGGKSSDSLQSFGQLIYQRGLEQPMNGQKIVELAKDPTAVEVHCLAPSCRSFRGEPQVHASATSTFDDGRRAKVFSPDQEGETSIQEQHR